MDKIKINNEIVQMRKFVKQAKVHIINKLVKEEKLLRDRKGNENQVLKAKRKADRLLAQIALIKKIKPDSISKLAISNALDWKTVLQQKNSSLEDRSIALLANYEPVQKEVKKFHADNEHLIAKIPEYLKEWEEKKVKLGTVSPKNNVKASELRQKKKERKLKKSVTNNTNIQKIKHSTVEQPSEILLKNDSISKAHIKESEDSDANILENAFENIDENENDECNNDSKAMCLNSVSDEVIDCVPSSDSDSEEKEDDHQTNLNYDSLTDFDAENAVKNTKERKFGNDHVQKSKRAKFSDSENMEIHSKKQNIFSDKSSDDLTIKNNVKTNIKELKQTFVNKSNNLKTIKILNLDELKECDKIPLTDSSGAEDSADEQLSDNEAVNVKETEQDDDPFFIREKNSNAQSNTKQNFKKLSSDSFTKKQTDFAKKDFKHFDKRKNIPAQQISDSRDKFSYLNKPSRHSNFRYGTERNKFDRPLGNKHFSKNQSISFLRKDKYNYKNESQQINAKNFLQNEYKKNVVFKNKSSVHEVKKKSSEDGPLHPSWEAKKKLSAKNVSFQGKRMVFDD